MEDSIFQWCFVQRVQLRCVIKAMKGNVSEKLILVKKCCVFEIPLIFFEMENSFSKNDKTRVERKVGNFDLENVSYW